MIDNSPSSRYIWSSSCGSCLMLIASMGLDERPPLSGTLGNCLVTGLELPLMGCRGVRQWVGENVASGPLVLGVLGCEPGEDEALLGG
jgi:hypothetical protein